MRDFAEAKAACLHSNIVWKFYHKYLLNIILLTEPAVESVQQFEEAVEEQAPADAGAADVVEQTSDPVETLPEAEGLATPPEAEETAAPPAADEDSPPDAAEDAPAEKESEEAPAEPDAGKIHCGLKREEVLNFTLVH